jgi:hypothetical protein
MTMDNEDRQITMCRAVVEGKAAPHLHEQYCDALRSYMAERGVDLPAYASREQLHAAAAKLLSDQRFVARRPAGGVSDGARHEPYSTSAGPRSDGARWGSDVVFSANQADAERVISLSMCETGRSVLESRGYSLRQVDRERERFQRSREGTAEARFEASPGAIAGDFVTRTAPVVFRAGRHPFPPEEGGDFEFTRDDLQRFVTSFKDPVEIECGHANTIFDGRLGQLIAVKASADGASFSGEFRIPKWFDSLFKGQPLPLSARWDRATKKMKKVAVTPNPRITDAAMQAAHAAFTAAAAPAAPPAPVVQTSQRLAPSERERLLSFCDVGREILRDRRRGSGPGGAA